MTGKLVLVAIVAALGITVEYGVISHGPTSPVAIVLLFWVVVIGWGALVNRIWTN